MADQKKYLQGMEMFGGAKMKISRIVMRDWDGKYFTVENKSEYIFNGLNQTVLSLHGVWHDCDSEAIQDLNDIKEKERRISGLLSEIINIVENSNNIRSVTYNIAEIKNSKLENEGEK